jgi:hypothetical protein
MGNGRSIDHVVVAVRDLEQAARSYQALGFTLTPRAMHDDRMGTSNRLTQFAAKNFVELLEVDRPDTLARHDFAASPSSLQLRRPQPNGRHGSRGGVHARIRD